MKITVVVDNHAMEGLAAEHGFSLWIETEEGNVLFDTGQGPAFEANVAALGIPLETARAIVLSHGHYDHTGGLPLALERNPSVPVYAHPDVFSNRFSLRDGILHAISIPRRAARELAARKANLSQTTHPVEILPGVWATGPIPRRNSFEDTGGSFFLDPDKRAADWIPDDQAMWVETAGGPVVLLGCAHAGVVNTLDYIGELTGRPVIRAVIGGMHLGRASTLRLEKTVEALERFAVGLVAPCHCTGEEATRFLHQHLPGRVTECAAGRVLQCDGE